MELFSQRVGEGPPLVILHGLYGSSDNWLAIAKALAPNFEVWLVDQRNHGRSPHDARHDYPAMRDDLLGFFDRNNIQRAIVLGHSMGGKTAMFFATAFPERVNALIVADIAPKSYLLHRDPNLGYTDHLKILQAFQSINVAQAASREEVESQMNALIGSPRITGFLMKNLHRKPSGGFEWRLNVNAIAEHMEHILSGLPAREFEQGRGVTGFPVLFIRGGKSGYILPEDYGLIRTVFPQAEIASIDGAGHWLHVEKPDALVRNIQYFLEI